LQVLSFLSALLLLGVSCGCGSQAGLIEPGESVAFRLLASEEADATIVGVAKEASGRFVRVDEQVRAEWVPVGEALAVAGRNTSNAVTREILKRSEVLVLHTANDISEKEIAGLEDRGEDASQAVTLVTLTDPGARRLFRFTVEHVGRTVAVIADGEVRGFPRIVTPITKAMVLSPAEMDKVRVVAAGDAKKSAEKK